MAGLPEQELVFLFDENMKRVGASQARPFLYLVPATSVSRHPPPSYGTAEPGEARG